MHKILRKHQPKISYRWAMINWSLLNIGLYIQPLETCLIFSCPLTLCPSISRQATSCPANLSKFVLHFHVRWFHVWTRGPSISHPSNSRLDILMVRHFHVRHFQRPQFYDSSQPYTDFDVRKVGWRRIKAWQILDGVPQRSTVTRNLNVKQPLLECTT